MFKSKEFACIDKNFVITPLALRFATEIMDYQAVKAAIPYELKLACFADGIKLKGENDILIKMTEQKINEVFMSNPLAFSLLFNALIKFTFEDDLKKNEEYSRVLEDLLA